MTSVVHFSGDRARRRLHDQSQQSCPNEDARPEEGDVLFNALRWGTRRASGETAREARRPPERVGMYHMAWEMASFEELERHSGYWRMALGSAATGIASAT